MPAGIVSIPEFTGIGTAVGRQFADVPEEEASIDEALDNSQRVTERRIARSQVLNQD